MRKQLLLIAVSVGILSGCLQRFQKNERIDLTCTEGSAWAKEIRETASKTYLYAQLASNAYVNPKDGTGRRTDFVLPSYIVWKDRVDNDDVGFAYDLYERTDKEKLETIIAFRGSEINRDDWIKGNVKGKQLQRALDTFAKISASKPDHNFAVVGDSLGGSLATQVSLCHKVDIAVSLNTSPRFKSKLCGDAGAILGANNRYSITEKGEFAKFLRLFGKEATQTYTSINCQSGGPIKNHNAGPLAQCLTRIASEVPGSGATESVQLNSAIFANYPVSNKVCGSGT